jgi:hypothetical protein
MPAIAVGVVNLIENFHYLVKINLLLPCHGNLILHTFGVASMFMPMDVVDW